MKINELRALIDFIEAKASYVVSNDLGLEGQDYTASRLLNSEKDLYKTFGFDYYKEKDKEMGIL